MCRVDACRDHRDSILFLFTSAEKVLTPMRLHHSNPSSHCSVDSRRVCNGVCLSVVSDMNETEHISHPELSFLAIVSRSFRTELSTESRHIVHANGRSDHALYADLFLEFGDAIWRRLQLQNPWA
jgi:hypothetical protein